MASISVRPNGRRIIQFTDGNRKRQTLRLGVVTKKDAESICRKVEHLLSAKASGEAVPPDVAEWVGKAGKVMVERLVAVGLLAAREASNNDLTLGAFLASYIAARTDVKPRTKINLEQAKRHLTDYFGAGRLLVSITAGDADEFRQQLVGKVADNTARRHCGRAKQFFQRAAKKNLIAVNPFEDMKGCGVRANKAREYFISRAEADAVLDACPDNEWKLIFALSRYGGLRCPSEHLALRWVDVDWGRSRMTIHSPKTEGHEGKELRVIPIFPELRPHLEAQWEAAVPGSEFIIARYRDSNANLRTALKRIIGRAGLKPWPKLFHNLRATRETELAESYPIQVVCDWIGNSPAVAAKHYLQTTDEHFTRGGAAKSEAVSTGTGGN